MTTNGPSAYLEAFQTALAQGQRIPVSCCLVHDLDALGANWVQRAFLVHLVATADLGQFRLGGVTQGKIAKRTVVSLVPSGLLVLAVAEVLLEPDIRLAEGGAVESALLGVETGWAQRWQVMIL